MPDETGSMDRKIGIDIGNVLTERRHEGFKPFAQNDYLSVRPMDTAFCSVKRVAGILGRENIYLVSRCSEENQCKAREWLYSWSFFDATGVPEENVRFFLHRPEKKDIAEYLQLEYVIDDRWSVLSHLLQATSIQKMWLFDPFDAEREEFSRYAGDRVTIAGSWHQIVEEIRSHKDQRETSKPR